MFGHVDAGMLIINKYELNNLNINVYRLIN